MPFVERRLDDPSGPDQQIKVDAIQYLLSKGITDEHLLAKINLESGYLTSETGTHNAFGIKEFDKTKGKLVQTTEALKAYTHADNGKGKRLRSDAEGIEFLKNKLAKRGGSIVFENGAIAYDKEGKIKLKDRFKNYNNPDEAFVDFKKQNARILADPTKAYATDQNYEKKMGSMLRETRYYLKHYRSSFGIPVEDNINNNFDEAHIKDITSADIVSTGIDSSIQQSLTKEQIRNSSASNEYYGNFFIDSIGDDYMPIEFGAGVQNKSDGFSVQANTVIDSTGEAVEDVDYNLQYKNKYINVNVGKKGDKDRQSISYKDGGLSATLGKEDGKTSFGIQYKGKIK